MQDNNEAGASPASADRLAERIERLAHVEECLTALGEGRATHGFVVNAEDARVVGTELKRLRLEVMALDGLLGSLLVDLSTDDVQRVLIRAALDAR